ncbi:MAG: efflux RND transporter periplasmic adaptor subunit [Burkholderiales bacterium]|nr:efflux RND transporter periplasmic adaptor subunit [Burkholderiales bacterium]
MTSAVSALRCIICIVSLALATSACGPSQDAAPPPPPPPEVAVVTLAPRTIPVVFEHVGQTAGVQEVEVRSRVSGILLSWNYEEGKVVRKGQSLFTIDPAPFQAARTRAEANLAAAHARRNQARREVERIEPLLEKGMITRKAYDDALATEEVAAAEVQAAQAMLEQARLDLDYTRVAAPLSGVTSRALKSIGSLVEAQQTLLTTISQVDPIHVVFSVSESDHLRLTSQSADGRLHLPKDGRFTVSVRTADGRTYARAGRVDFTDVRINPSTGAGEMRAVLPNPDQSLRPGQFVRVRLEGGSFPDALAVPQRAVLEGPQGKLVLVVNASNVVEPRPVQVGQWSGDDWIITQGLQAGERVMVDGMAKAPPGATVRVTQFVPEGQPATPPPATERGSAGGAQAAQN